MSRKEPQHSAVMYGRTFLLICYLDHSHTHGGPCMLSASTGRSGYKLATTSISSGHTSAIISRTGIVKLYRSTGDDGGMLR